MVTPHEKNPDVAIKWIENRSWFPDCKPGSIILIHASGTIGDPEEYAEFGYRINELRHGAIIGYATLAEPIKFHCPAFSYRNYDKIQSINRMHHKRLRFVMPDHIQTPRHGIGHAEMCGGTVHWIFHSPVTLEKPIPCPGKLRLWRYPS